MNSYPYMAFEISLNPPQFCQEHLAHNFELTQIANNNSGNNIIHRSFNYYTENKFGFSVLISEFSSSNPNSDLFWGYIYIDTNLFSDEIIDPDIQSKYDLNVRILIPQELTKWNTDIKPRYLSIHP